MITAEKLNQIPKLEKPTDTEIRLAWIAGAIMFDYSRGKKGCCVPLSELCIDRNNHTTIINALILHLENAGYQARLVINKELIGDCLEIVWG